MIFREDGLERETYQYPETASVPCLYVARRRIEPEPFVVRRLDSGGWL